MQHDHEPAVDLLGSWDFDCTGRHVLVSDLTPGCSRPRRRKLIASRVFGKYRFELVGAIRPDRTSTGRVATYAYKLPEGRRPNVHGMGPFCRFDFPKEWPYSGVYAITVGQQVAYIGECQNLSERLGQVATGT
jgi:hypothetical protein